jgi:hypothetical protein
MGALCHRFELGDACTLSSKPENAVSLSLAHMDESESRSDRLCAKYLNGPICVWLQPLTHAQRVEPLSRECDYASWPHYR